MSAAYRYLHCHQGGQEGSTDTRTQLTQSGFTSGCSISQSRSDTCSRSGESERKSAGGGSLARPDSLSGR